MTLAVGGMYNLITHSFCLNPLVVGIEAEIDDKIESAMV